MLVKHKIRGRVDVSSQRSIFDAPPGGLGISRAIKPIVGALGILLAVSLLILILLSGALAVLLAFVGVSFVAYHSGVLVIAKSKVLHDKEVRLWNGYARLVAWNPAEGVVFLKNKRIDYLDDNPGDGGGIRLIFPFLGEELVLRTPLEIQTFTFSDHEVLTKEYVPLSIRGTMYWRIVDLSKFYLSISQEIHTTSDQGAHSIAVSSRRPQLESAEHWLRSMAEEKTRAVVSRIGTGLLIADQLSADLPALGEGNGNLISGPQSSEGYRTATDSLAGTIKTAFEASVGEYGLEIHRVALQEVKLPSDIYSTAVEACRSAYLPLKARAEAIAQKMKLQAEADVLGADALGMKEIAGNIPALAFQEFLSPLFLDFNRRRGIGAAP